jgi:hypothetical protein
MVGVCHPSDPVAPINERGNPPPRTAETANNHVERMGIA